MSKLLPTVSPEIFPYRFADEMLTPGLSSVDTLYSATAKPFYYKNVGDKEAITVKIDFQSLNNPFVTRTDDNIILTTP
jgi:hypothetical protein